MFTIVKMNNKTAVFIVIFIFIVISTCFLLTRHSNQNVQATMQQDYESQSVCKKALVNTYLNDIEQATIDFYSEYFTTEPRVQYFVITVKKISSVNSTSFITFISEPFIGPHITIGKDEITFSANFTAEVKLSEFNHIISYTLPDHLKSLASKRIPGEYE